MPALGGATQIADRATSTREPAGAKWVKGARKL